jgi:hypothetical protein
MPYGENGKWMQGNPARGQWILPWVGQFVFGWNGKPGPLFPIKHLVRQINRLSISTCDKWFGQSLLFLKG